jgi:hypothetical protein
MVERVRARRVGTGVAGDGQGRALPGVARRPRLIDTLSHDASSPLPLFIHAHSLNSTLNLANKWALVSGNGPGGE